MAKSSQAKKGTNKSSKVKEEVKVKETKKEEKVKVENKTKKEEIKKENKKVEKNEKEEIKEEKVKEKDTEENGDDEFFGKKGKKDEDEKSIFSRVMNVILWILLIVWMIICLIDFYNVRKEKKPIFCLSNHTTTYSDGKVYSCTGLGYKVYTYKRDSYNAIEFGPFWSKDRSADLEVVESNSNSDTSKKSNNNKTSNKKSNSNKNKK